MDFAVPVDYRVKIKENEKRQVHGLRQRTKKAIEHEDDGDTNYNKWTWSTTQTLGNNNNDKNYIK